MEHTARATRGALMRLIARTSSARRCPILSIYAHTRLVYIRGGRARFIKILGHPLARHDNIYHARTERGKKSARQRGAARYRGIPLAL